MLDELFDLSLYRVRIIPSRHLGLGSVKRVLSNLVIIAAAVGITFAIGAITRRAWGIAL